MKFHLILTFQRGIYTFMSEQNLKTKLVSTLSTLKKNKYFPMILVISLVLLIALILFSGKTKNVQTTETTDNYVLNLENKLETLLESIDNVGDVTVAITVDGGTETVIAMKTVTTENEQGKVIEQTPITVNGKTVTLKEVNPDITGVLIVAKGADNLSTYIKIQQATISMLNVDANKIEILTMK